MGAGKKSATWLIHHKNNVTSHINARRLYPVVSFSPDQNGTASSVTIFDNDDNMVETFFLEELVPPYCSLEIHEPPYRRGRPEPAGLSREFKPHSG